MRKLKELITKYIIKEGPQKGKLHKMILRTASISIGKEKYKENLKLVDNGRWNGADTLILSTRKSFDGDGSFVMIDKVGEPEYGDVYFSRGVLIDKKAIKKVIAYLKKIDEENNE